MEIDKQIAVDEAAMLSGFSQRFMDISRQIAASAPDYPIDKAVLMEYLLMLKSTCDARAVLWKNLLGAD